MSGAFDEGENLVKGGDYVGMKSVIFSLSPAIALKPDGLTPGFLCGNNILGIAVADYEHLLGLQAESLHSKRENLGIGLSLNLNVFSKRPVSRA